MRYELYELWQIGVEEVEEPHLVLTDDECVDFFEEGDPLAEELFGE